MILVRRILTAATALALAGGGFAPAPLSAAETAPAAAPAPATAEATLQEWIAALKGNDPAAFYRRLPASRQADLADAWREAMPRDGQRGRGFGPAMMLERLLPALGTAETAKPLAAQLGQALVAIGRLGAGKRVEPPAAGEGQDPRAAFLPMMIATQAVQAMTASVLADGLETRQATVLKALFADWEAWTATAGLDDAAKQGAAATALAEVGTALGAADGIAKVELPELLTRAGAALAPLKQAFAAYGADLDAVLASATVKPDPSVPATAEGTVVLLTFTAFAKPRELPLKLKQGANGWEIVADSPIAAWMRPQFGMGNLRGRQAGPGGRRAPGQDGGAAPAPQGGQSF